MADPGNTLNTAQVQDSPTFVALEQVSQTDSSDIYQFSVTQSGIFTADLSHLTGDADVRLIQNTNNNNQIDLGEIRKDNNNNDQIDRSEIIAWQWERGTKSESIRHFLDPGTYFIEVISHRGQEASYKLSTQFKVAERDEQKFDIQFNNNFRNILLDSGLNEATINALEEAAQVWESAISHSAIRIGRNFPQYVPHVLRVDVSTRILDSATALMQAAPTEYGISLNGKRLPVAGSVNINTNKLSELDSDVGLAREVMVHELGHILGIGNLWDRFIDRKTATYKADTYAGWAYGELLDTNEQFMVLVEPKVLGHWAEEVFDAEMMSPAVDLEEPLSQLTIAALRDIGWNVNYGEAQSYSFASPIRKSELGVTITQVKALDDDGLDGGARGGLADFYAKVSIYGIQKEFPEIRDKNEIFPNWKLSRQIPFSWSGASIIPITISIHEADGGGGIPDNQGDINPVPGEKSLHLWYDLDKGQVLNLAKTLDPDNPIDPTSSWQSPDSNGQFYFEGEGETGKADDKVGVWFTIQLELATVGVDGTLTLKTDLSDSFSIKHIGGEAGNEVVEVRMNQLTQRFGPSTSGGTFTQILALGSQGNDTFTFDGVLTTAWLEGGDGNDRLEIMNSPIGITQGSTLLGNAGNDFIRGGSGSDNIHGDIGADTLFGSEGDDWITGGGDDDWVDGGTGNDILSGDSGNPGVDTIFGGVGSDIIGGGGNADLIQGGDGDDQIWGDSSFDLPDVRTTANPGTEGNDTLDGGNGNDQIYGELGDDELTGSAGDDLLDGGEGIDTASYRNDPGFVSVNLEDGTARDGFGNADKLQNIENIIGSGFNDRIIGDRNINRIYAGDGDDRVEARGGNDTLLGEAGNDTLLGETGDDLLIGGIGADLLDGGLGSDTASYSTSALGVIANLSTGRGATGDARGDVYESIENLEGSQLSDRLIGDEHNNILSGLGGDDFLDGRAGDDQLFGNSGNDNLDGGNGNDTLDGSSGDDFLYGAEGDDVLVGGTGDDYLEAGCGDDILNGNDGQDWLEAGEGADQLYGEAGDDVLFGSTDNDTLNGGSGNDSLDGGTGDDWLVGGAGVDQLDGGEGNDTADLSDVETGINANLSVGTFSYLDTLGVAVTEVIRNIENIIGTQFSDTLTGNQAANRLEGGNGNDRLSGGNGNDTLLGGAGDDWLAGNAGIDLIDGGEGFDLALLGDLPSGVRADLNTDQITYQDTAGNILTEIIRNIEGITSGEFNDELIGDAGTNRFDGRGGNDILRGGLGDDYFLGGDGIDFIDGEDGFDTVNLVEDFDFGVVANLSAGTVTYTDATGSTTTETILNIESVIATQFDDEVIGSDADNLLYGFGGNDRLFGGDGNDGLVGGDGIDFIDGGGGFDTADLVHINRALVANLNAGTVTYTDAAGTSVTEIILNIEAIIATQFNDTLIGNDSNNRLNGGAGSDRLFGEAGNDELIGGDGDDILAGGSGSLNRLSGNAGSDIFVLASDGFSQVLDFELGKDRIGLPENLTVSQLKIEQGTGINASSTWIKLTRDNSNLMLLSNIQASALTTNMFLPASAYQSSRLV